MPPPLPQADLHAILAATAPLWPEMRHQRLFLTGGTGFFGCWLVESFLHANRALALDASVTILTRDPAAFRRKLPRLAFAPELTLLEDDVRRFDFPAEPHAFVIHAATEASARLLAENPEEMRATILAGTRRVLQFARANGTHKLLFTSSGAVYGPQPPDLSHIPEDFFPPRPGSNAYGQAKLTAEATCAEFQSPALEIKIARCFAFLGPHLPLDTHFAAGNFLADALAGRPLRIAGDGTTLRSYLYAADLATWLWTMLFRAPRGVYNVGSEDAVSIRELAETVVRAVRPGLPIEIAEAPDVTRQPGRYVPSTSRARTELGLRQTIPLHEALRRTARWHQLK